MKLNIYLHELRRHLHSVFYWSLGVVAVNFIYMYFFPPFAEQAELINEALAGFPKEFLAAFGMDRVNLATVLGYYSLVFLFVQILIAVQAGNYGAGLISREESQFTADFLLTKPVTRWQVFISKYLAGLTALLATGAVVWLSAFAGIEAFRGRRPYETGALVLLLCGLLIFQLFFFHAGLAISQFVRRIRSATPYGLGMGFGMYALSAFSNIAGEVKLEWITPFKHFDPTYIVNHHAFDMRLFWLNVAISLLALGVAIWRFLTRDILGVS